MRGPIDYIIVGFEGNTFDGSILAALGEAIEARVINLVALAFISKDDAGNVTVLDIGDNGDTVVMDFVTKYEGNPALVTDDDINEMADLLENNTSAGLLVVEQAWAIPLKQALVNANGVLVAEGRIHPDAVVELEN